MTSKNNDNSQEAYFTLRAVHTTGNGTRGRQLMAGADIIHIGQTADCEWHLDNTTPYVDEVYAVIRPSQLNGEWVLVPTSEHVGVSVNGSNVSLIHYMHDGDIISFDGERLELRFNVHHDGRYNSDIGIVYIPVKLSTSTKLSLGIIAAVVITCLWWFGIHIPNIRQANVNKKLYELSSSVCQISVDNVYYVVAIKTKDGTKRDSILDCYSYNNEGGGVISGTAFIVNDTLLVTARHCIQPWLNDPIINEVISPDSLPEKDPVRWAFEAETVNQLSGNEDSLRLITQCMLYWGEKCDTCTSDDFIIDNRRDDIVPKGDYKSHNYWRSITKRGEKKSQMLGDVAFRVIQRHRNNNLHLADSNYMSNNLGMDKKLYFLGYPDNDNGKSFEYKDGTLKKAYKDHELLSHDSEITHGYSGGPVLVLDEDKVSGKMTATVVGVISLVDSKVSYRTYSVPVTEINKQILDKQ